MKGIAAGIIAGIAGAVVWAIVAYYSGYEIGWLAWGIGAAVGAAVAWGTDGGTANGVIAVAISIIAIVAGKFITVEIMIDKEVKVIREAVLQGFEEEENLIVWLADRIIAARQESGLIVRWPAGVDPEEAYSIDQYPKDVAEEAKTLWESKTDQEKQQLKELAFEEFEYKLNNEVSSVKSEVFADSFGLFDLLFFFLAIGTSYRIASGTKD
ncbi:MAG: hypothetical protein KAS23_04630 [Anaerohalosphaera sp.]|nr:hypothetical protein [Anaerohalosphaera sp.]